MYLKQHNTQYLANYIDKRRGGGMYYYSFTASEERILPMGLDGLVGIEIFYSN